MKLCMLRWCKEQYSIEKEKTQHCANILFFWEKEEITPLNGKRTWKSSAHTRTASQSN